MIIKSNSIILATDLSPAFMPVSAFSSYKKGLYPLAIVNSLSFNVQNSRIQKKQLSSQSLSINALQYSPTIDVSFNYTSSLAFENENFLGIYFKAYEDYTSSFLNANDHSCNLYFIVSDLYASDLIKYIETRETLNGLTAIAFGNCSLSSYALSLQATDLPSVSAQMQAVNMTMSTISSSLISTPAINLSVGDQIGAAQLSINNPLFIEHLQRLNTQSGNFPILPTRDSLYFQITNQNLQVPSVKISPSEDSAINSLELSFGIEREESYGFGSNFIYDSKIKYPILGNLSLSATSLNLHTGDGSLTGSMRSEQDYTLELMFSGVNENSKFIKINNAKLESHSYEMDYAGVLSAQYAFNFECNEATGIAVKWGQATEGSTGILLSFENLQLRSSEGSGLAFTLPAPSPPPPPPPPPAPTVGSFSFTLATGSGPSVNVNWSAAANATGYAIFQSEDNVSYSQIYSGNGVYLYNDSSVEGGGEYPNYYFYYMVGFSGASNYTTSTQNIGVE